MIPPRSEPTYTRRQIAAGAFAAGILVGWILGLASCSAPDYPQPYSPTTAGGHQ